MTDWIEIKSDNDLPDGPGGICQIKRTNENIVNAYYHRDKMAWLHSYCNFDWSHWQDMETREWLIDVTHWRPIKYE